jgi:hypothetical protein
LTIAFQVITSVLEQENTVLECLDVANNSLRCGPDTPESDRPGMCISRLLSHNRTIKAIGLPVVLSTSCARQIIRASIDLEALLWRHATYNYGDVLPTLFEVIPDLCALMAGSTKLKELQLANTGDWNLLQKTLFFRNGALDRKRLQMITSVYEKAWPRPWGHFRQPPLQRLHLDNHDFSLTPEMPLDTRPGTCVARMISQQLCSTLNLKIDSAKPEP